MAHVTRKRGKMSYGSCFNAGGTADNVLSEIKKEHMHENFADAKASA